MSSGSCPATCPWPPGPPSDTLQHLGRRLRALGCHWKCSLVQKRGLLGGGTRGPEARQPGKEPSRTPPALPPEHGSPPPPAPPAARVGPEGQWGRAGGGGSVLGSPAGFREQSLGLDAEGHLPFRKVVTNGTQAMGRGGRQSKEEEMRTHAACYWENKSPDGVEWVGRGVQVKLYKAQKPSVLLPNEILCGRPIWRRHRSAVVWVEARTGVNPTS